MSGIEKQARDPDYIEYICDCGKSTEYGIFRWHDNQKKEWAIDSCCGGGCNAANNIQFCPYCGTKIEVISERKTE